MSLIDNWNEELQSAYLYRVLAKCERSPTNIKLFNDLADAAQTQSRIWETKIRTQNPQFNASFKPTLRTHIVSKLIKTLGPRAIRPVLAATKVRGLSIYRSGILLQGHAMPTSVDDIGHRHSNVSEVGNLRAAVFGVNDGLISNASLVMGMAGATTDTNIVFLAGIAGLIAGATSMAAGEYVSVRSQRDLYEYQIGLERDELNEYPEEEAEELALIYNARGVPIEQARAMSAEIMRDPEYALDTLAREELGLNPDDLGSPWGAAASSFTAFSIGAFIPLIPFLLVTQSAPTLEIMGVTLVGLFTVGALISLFTGKGAFMSGIRMMLIGATAGLLSHMIGIWLGHALF